MVGKKIVKDLVSNYETKGKKVVSEVVKDYTKKSRKLKW
jgi:hypothetical protein